MGQGMIPRLLLSAAEMILILPYSSNCSKFCAMSSSYHHLQKDLKAYTDVHSLKVIYILIQDTGHNF